MYPIGVVGREAERFAERLVNSLCEHGRVSVITNDRRADGGIEPPAADGGTVRNQPTEECTRYRTAGATSAYAIDDEKWSAVGDGMGLHDVLYTVAPDCDFCVIVGESAPSTPTVVLDEEATVAGPVLARAPDGDAIDLEDIRGELLATEPVETLESLVETVKESKSAPQSGAIATFTGRVRAQEGTEDTPTEYLEFEKYEGVADERIARISAELENREGVFEVLMHHRSGRLDYGEDIVFVVVLAGHRGEAFRTVEDGINRLKAEVPIFKKEVTIDEEFWVHDRP